MESQLSSQINNPTYEIQANPILNTIKTVKTCKTDLSITEIKTRLLAMGVLFDISSNSISFLKKLYLKQLKNPSKIAFIANRLKEDGYNSEEIRLFSKKKRKLNSGSKEREKGSLIIKSNQKITNHFTINTSINNIINSNLNINSNQQTQSNPILKPRNTSNPQPLSVNQPSTCYKISTCYLNRSNSRLRTVNDSKAKSNCMTSSKRQSTISKKPFFSNRSLLNMMNDLQNKKFYKWNIISDEDLIKVDYNEFKRQLDLYKNELYSNKTNRNQYEIQEKLYKKIDFHRRNIKFGHGNGKIEENERIIKYIYVFLVVFILLSLLNNFFL